jgi:hypothetical protein
MERKINFGILLLASALALVGCQTSNGTSQLTATNAQFNLLDNRESKKSVSIGKVSLPANYNVVSTPAEALSQGWVMVGESGGTTFGVYSLLFDRLIVPLSYEAITAYQTAAGGTYIQATRNSGKNFDLYDYRGYEVASDLDPSLTFALSAEVAEDAWSNKKYLRESYTNGETIVRSVGADGSRNSIESLIAKPAAGDTLMISTGGEKTDMKLFGLEGYYGIETQNASDNRLFFSIYKNYDNTLVSSFQIPNVPASLMFGKTLIYQSDTLVADDATDYTYATYARDAGSSINTGKVVKYLLKTYAIELLTGKQKELDVSYKITAGSYFRDDSGIANAGLVECYDVANKRIVTEYPKTYIIGVDGAINYDATSDPAYGSLILSDSRYFNPNTYQLLNESFTPIASFGALPNQINYGDQCLSLRYQNANYGLVDFDGKVVFGFDYSLLQASTLLNGCVFGVNASNSLYYSLDTVNKKATSHTFVEGSVVTDTGLGYLKVQTGTSYSYLGYDWALAVSAITDLDAGSKKLSTYFGSYYLQAFQSATELAYFRIIKQ